MISSIAALNYGARLSGVEAQPDLFFRWSTFIGTLVLEGVVLAVMLLIARGLPFREAFALRRPASWRDAWRGAGTALAVIYAVSFAEEIGLGHLAREQALPTFWDPSRADAFVANAAAIALYVPLVEEAMCRGIGFRLLEAFGPRTAVVVSAVAFALAHGAVYDLPWVLTTGIGLGYLRSRSGSLFPCIGLHAMVNGVALVAAALLSSS